MCSSPLFTKGETEWKRIFLGYVLFIYLCIFIFEEKMFEKFGLHWWANCAGNGIQYFVTTGTFGCAMWCVMLVSASQAKIIQSSFPANSDKVAVVKDKMLCGCNSEVFSKRVFEVTKKNWRFLTTSKSRTWHREVGNGRTFFEGSVNLQMPVCNSTV